MRKASQARLWIVGGLVAALAAGLVWRWAGPAGLSMSVARGGDSAAQAHLIPVRVMAAGAGRPPRSARAYRGTVQPARSADLSFRRGGRIEQIRVREGAVVRAGDILAELDDRDLRAGLSRVEAQLAEAEAVLEEQVAGPRRQTIEAAAAEVRRLEAALLLAQSTRDREQSLQGSSASSRQAWDEARAGADQASAALEAARARLDELKEGTRPEQIRASRARLQALQAQREDLLVQIGDCRIAAPFDGQVARRMVDEGVIAGPDRPVLRVIETDPLEARFGIAPQDARAFAPGQPAAIEAGGARIAGRVARIEPELDLATRTLGIVISLSAEEVGGRLVPGQTVSLPLEFSAGEQEGEDSGSFWLPVQALTRSVRGLWSVLVVVPDPAAPDGRRWLVERRDVPVLATEGEMVRIGAGLVRKGDWIAVEGTHRIAPGMAVQPLMLGEQAVPEDREPGSADEGEGAGANALLPGGVASDR